MTSTLRSLALSGALLAALALPAYGHAAALEQAASPGPTEQARSENDAMLALAERHAAAALKANPEAATSLGVGEDVAGEGYASRLSDYSLAARAEAAALNERFLRELRGIDRDRLTGTALVTYDVLLDAYETAAARDEFGFGGAVAYGSTGPYPVTQISGPHIDLPRLLLTEQPLAAPADAEAYLARLEALPTALTQAASTVERDAAEGVIPPAFALEKAAAGIDALVSPDPAAHPLVARLFGAVDGMEGLTPEARRELKDRAVASVTEGVYPAYAALAAALRGLAEDAGEEAGLSRLAEGEAFYQHALDSYGAGGRTPAEIHQLGLDEVERVSAEMTTILDEMDAGAGRTAGERFARLAKGPGMLYPNDDAGKEALLARLREQVAIVQGMAPDWFGTLPPQPVEVRRVPPYEEGSAPGGYYTSPSLDGERPGIYWINLKDTADWPRYTLKTLTYHEAVPGHHFQIALQQDVGDMPLIRKAMFLSQFGEGWALYAEGLAEEMGLYADDPLGRLGKLQSELFRAARLVVDTGLHAKEWSREEAIDWMVRTTGETRASVEREVERYSVWPGQATSYKLGQLKISELRERAEAALGDGFDVAAFHDLVLLDGAVPLPVLEERVDAWIEAGGAP